MKLSADSKMGIKVGAIVLTIVVFVVTASFLFVDSQWQIKERQHKTYDAWCKYTGNPRQLTYEEYSLLGGSRALDK